MPLSRLRGSHLTGAIFMRVFLLVMVLLWIIPPLGLLISSLRSEEAVATTGWWRAIANPIRDGAWTFANYARVLFSDRLGTAFLNSLLVTIPATVIPIITAAFAAYSMAWMRYRGRRLFLVGILVLLVVPLQMSLIPILRIYTDLRLNGTFIGIWLAHTGFGLPLAIYLIYGYIRTLPGSIIESAFIDGAPHYLIFTRLVFPPDPTRPGIVRHLPIPMGVERPPGCPGVLRQRRRTDPPDHPALGTSGVTGPGLARPDRRGVCNHGPAVDYIFCPAALFCPRSISRKRKRVARLHNFLGAPRLCALRAPRPVGLCAARPAH